MQLLIVQSVGDSLPPTEITCTYCTTVKMSKKFTFINLNITITTHVINTHVIKNLFGLMPHFPAYFQDIFGITLPRYWTVRLSLLLLSFGLMPRKTTQL